ncbi:hypothetical protein PLESTM_001724300 [Pleodorina starrii]|nr:hypothetical protein PLESTM_001724300 [Pleodorina starrii]
MGGSCSHAADAWANLATKEELREAVKSIEAWQKLQDQSRAAGHAAGNRNSSKGPLLQRVGGLDVVKQVVEGFYRRLYSDKRLLTFLHDKDMTYLRAKQTLFMSWLFGPPNQPYTGRNVRIAHLKLIKQRGFSPEDFDLGMEYFEQAMRELEAPETIISEVMCKVRPFKTVIFTPCERDADEEARWAFEERVKEQQSAAKEKEKERQQSLKEKQQSMSPSKADADAAAALAGQPASAAPQLLPSSSGLSPAATGRTEQLRSTKSGSRPAAAAAAPPPPQPQSLSRSPAAQAQSSTQAAKAGSRPPSAIPQPPPKKPAGSRPASAVPTPPPAALQRQASRAGAASRPASGSPPAPSPDGPFSVARDLADLARSASQAGGGGGAAAAAAAAGTLPPAVSGGSLRRLTTGPCAESAEVDRFWEAEITAAAAAAADAQGGRPGAAAGAAANGLPQARVSSRSLGATEASAAAAAGGGGAKPERPALLALEMAVEMGLAEPEEGEDGGAAGDAAAAAAAVAAAGGSGGVEIVDAFLTEMLEKEAQGKTAA